MKELLKKEWKVILTELVLTILLMVELQYIMGQRTEYCDMSAEPVWTGNSETVLKGESYTQEINSSKDKIAGVAEYIETPVAESDTEVMLFVYNSEGELLAQSKQLIEPNFSGYWKFFFEKPLMGMINQKLLCKYQNGTASQLVLKCGYCENVLCNEGTNICTRLIYDFLEVPRYKITVYFWGFLLWLVLSVFLIFIIKRRTTPEYVFAFLYLSLGICYMAVNPLYGVADEGSHFQRAYGITEGSFIAGQDEFGRGGSELPDNITYNNKGPFMKLPDVMEAKNLVLSTEKTFIAYGASSLYSPFTYTPQVVGIFLGKLVSRRVIFIAYCGRVAAWITVGVILFFCIRYLPFGKNILAVVSLLPMNMHESISLAGDGFTFAIAAAFITFVLYARFTQTEQLRRLQYVLLYILLFFIASCKVVYVPLAMAAFLIPKERFGSMKRYGWNVVIAVFLVGFTSISWLMVSSEWLIEFNPGVDSSEQVRFVLSRPLEYIEILARTVLNYGENMVKSMLGSSLGWLNIDINSSIIALVASSLIYVCVNEKLIWPEEVWSREKALWERGLLFFICGCVILLIYTSLYVQWTAVGNGTIEGVQGRYFLPVLFPFILALKSRDRGCVYAQESGGTNTGYYLVMLLSGILTVATCLTHYII